MTDTRVRIEGVQAFTMKMASLPDAVRRGVLRKLMREAMQVVRDDARSKVPVLAKPVLSGSGAPRRLPGTLRKAISVRTSKVEAKAGNVGVFVNVRPLPGNIYRKAGPANVLVKRTSRGADNPRDPYYWRWIEFGTKVRKTRKGKLLGAVRAYRFLQDAANLIKVAGDKLQQGMRAWAQDVNKSGQIK